jgi:hypothetical protein
MLTSSRKKLIVVVAVLLALVLAVAGWLYSNRVERVAMAEYVPAAALGYAEVNDWPQLLDRLTATRAWQELAPAYGLADRLKFAGKLGGLAQYAGGLGGEAAMLARSQVAVVVTGLEVRGEQVKPRWALLVETHTRPGSLQTTVEARLPELARRALGKAMRTTIEHNGVAIVAYKAANRQGEEKQLLSAQIEGEWLLANHPDALRACIDARQGRVAALAGSAQLQKARPAVGRAGEVFGFITGDGVTRLLRFGAYLLAGGAIGNIGKAALAGAVGDVVTDFVGKSTDGAAYSVSFENGGVVDRYAMLLKPDLLGSLQGALKINQREPRLLNLIPATVEEATLLNLENPGQAFGALETVIAARVGVGQSFMLRHFLKGVQEAFLGLRVDELAARAIGDEAASLNFTDDVDNRLWLLTIRDRALMRRLLEKLLTVGGFSLQTEAAAGGELWHSSDTSRGSAFFFGSYVVLGRREQLLHLLAARRGLALAAAPQLTQASKPAQNGLMLSWAATKEDAAAMMETLARLLKVSEESPAPAALDELPFAVSAMSFNQQGLYVEAHAPLGSFPLYMAIAEGALRGQ